MVEILTKGGFEETKRTLDLTSAVCTYQRRCNANVILYDNFQVWALSDEDFSNLSAFEWNSDFGNWLYNAGDGCDPVDAEFLVNGAFIKAWNGSERKSWCLKCDYATYGQCAGTELDKDGCYSNRRYRNLISYLNDELGIRPSMRSSMWAEFGACTAALAKQNGMKLSELFQKYIG